MNTTAYLVVHLDTSVSPPRFVGAGIYSERAHELTCAVGRKTFALDVTHSHGKDFEDAIRNLREAKTHWRGALDWAFALLPESER